MRLPSGRTLSSLACTRMGAGLYLQATERSGADLAKSWIYRFMLNGRAREMGLGPLSAVSLAEAREKAAGCRKLRTEGQGDNCRFDALRSSLVNAMGPGRWSHHLIGSASGDHLRAFLRLRRLPSDLPCFENLGPPVGSFFVRITHLQYGHKAQDTPRDRIPISKVYFLQRHRQMGVVMRDCNQAAMLRVPHAREPARQTMSHASRWTLRSLGGFAPPGSNDQRTLLV